MANEKLQVIDTKGLEGKAKSWSNSVQTFSTLNSSDNAPSQVQYKAQRLHSKSKLDVLEANASDVYHLEGASCMKYQPTHATKFKPTTKAQTFQG